MTLPQLFSVATGCITALVSLSFFVRYRTLRFKALFWLTVGASMIFAGFRPSMIRLWGEDSIELRVRFVVAILSFIVLTVTFESIRVAKMLERYAFLWLVTGGILLLGALYPDLARWVGLLTGMSYSVSVLVLVFVFVLLMLFHFSMALSVTQYKLGQVARALALTEERLRRVESCDGKDSAEESA